MKSLPMRLRKREKPLGLLLLLGILLATFGALFSATPALAADTCTQDATTACIQGIVRSSDKEPIADAEISLTGPGGADTTTSGEDGRWFFAVDAAGEYTVTIDPATLPEGQFIAQVDSRTVQASLNGNVAALFPLTDDIAVAEADVEAGSQANPFSWPRFWQQFVSGIRMGLLIALASLGLSLVFGTTGISNFSQGEMVSLGGILAWMFMTLTGNLLLSGILAVLGAALFGYLQDKVLWAPLRKRRLSLMQLMIVSIGLSILLQYTFQLLFGAGVIRIDPRTPETITMLGITLTVQSYIAMGVSLLAIIGVGIALMYTRFGRATRAISDNPSLAEASGINVNKVVRLVWIIGSGLAGLSGVFFGLVFNGINWFTGGQMLLLFFAAVTLGGLGTAFGAFVGSMVIGMMVELTNIWLPGDLKYATALLLLILILLVRPQGIFGRKERIG